MIARGLFHKVKFFISIKKDELLLVLRTWCRCWSHIVADKSNDHQDYKNKENEFEHSHGLSPPTHITYHI